MRYKIKLVYFHQKEDHRVIVHQLSKGLDARYVPGGGLSFSYPYNNDEYDFVVIFVRRVHTLLNTIEESCVDYIVVDDREWNSTLIEESLTWRLLESLNRVRDKVVRFSRSSIVTLIDENSNYLSEQSFALGKLYIKEVVPAPFVNHRLLKRLVSYIRERRPGKVALCLAGGGVEGLLYEIGVLRALESFMVNYRIIDFDIFCGISAGAVIASFLANGVGPEELAIGLRDGAYGIERIKKFDIFKPNFSELFYRVYQLLRTSGDIISKGSFYNWIIRLMPNGVASGDRLMDYMEKNLSKEGRTNSFRQLTKELYIGATDQDTGEHVVFGEEGWDDIPISMAVRASSALIPFYPPIKIKDRYYVDGAFTRTTNFKVAIEHGATLVIIVNPLVAVVSSEPGFVAAQGGIYSTMQGIKSLVATRFSQAIQSAIDTYPNISFFVFQPHGEEMKLMAGTLMRYFYREEVQDIGFETALRKIRSNFKVMRSAFERHRIYLRDPMDNVSSKIPSIEELKVAG